MNEILTKINLIGAAITTFFAAIFGAYWYLFAAFLALNVVDYITGIFKARLYKVENSSKGVKGIVKKVGYWVTIAIAFFLAYSFNDLGALIGLDLGFTILLGWFILAIFIINEIRSILENLVEIGVEVPVWLVKGLEVANDKLNSAVGGDDDEDRS